MSAFPSECCQRLAVSISFRRLLSHIHFFEITGNFHVVSKSTSEVQYNVLTKENDRETQCSSTDVTSISGDQLNLFEPQFPLSIYRRELELYDLLVFS
jgi:hypothetical protein